MFKIANKEHLITPAHLDHLQKLRDFITQIGQKYHYSRQMVNAFKLAVDEAATNIINHAYGDNNGYITIEAVIGRKKLTINLIDQGIYFDPKWSNDPDFNEYGATVKPGLGIFMMRRLMDNIQYRKTDKGNQLTLSKTDARKAAAPKLRQLWDMPFSLRLRYFVQTILIVTILNIAGFSIYFFGAEAEITQKIIILGKQLSQQIAHQISAVKPSLLTGRDGISYINGITTPFLTDNFGIIHSFSIENNDGYIYWSTSTADSRIFHRPEKLQILDENVYTYSVTPDIVILEFDEPLSFEEEAPFKKIHVYLYQSYLQRELGKRRVEYLKTCCVILGASYLLLALLGYLISHPIRKLSQWVQATKSGELDKDWAIDSSSELGEIAMAFSDITEKFEQTQKHLAKNEQFEHEMKIAQQVQASLLPKQVPQVDSLEIATHYEAAMSVGGDYYDFINIDEDHLGIAIADVSGKGFAGSLIMTIVRTALRTEARGMLNAAEVLTRVNELTVNDISNGMFITVLYLIINTKTGETNFANAGHTPLIVYRGKTGESFYLNPPGFPIGLQLPGPKSFSDSIQSEVVRINPEDTLVLYTDGVTENMNRAREPFGEERLLDFIRKNAKQSVEQIGQLLKNALYSYREDTPPHDDITFLFLRMRERMDASETNEHSDIDLETKFLSVEKTKKIFDVIREHPDFDAEAINAFLSNELSDRLQLEPGRIQAELKKRNLQTHQLRNDFISAIRRSGRNFIQPATPQLLSGKISPVDPKKEEVMEPANDNPKTPKPTTKKKAGRKAKSNDQQNELEQLALPEPIAETLTKESQPAAAELNDQTDNEAQATIDKAKTNENQPVTTEIDSKSDDEAQAVIAETLAEESQTAEAEINDQTDNEAQATIDKAKANENQPAAVKPKSKTKRKKTTSKAKENQPVTTEIDSKSDDETQAVIAETLAKESQTAEADDKTDNETQATIDKPKTNKKQPAAVKPKGKTKRKKTTSKAKGNQPVTTEIDSKSDDETQEAIAETLAKESQTTAAETDDKSTVENISSPVIEADFVLGDFIDKILTEKDSPGNQEEAEKNVTSNRDEKHQEETEPASAALSKQLIASFEETDISDSLVDTIFDTYAVLPARPLVETISQPLSADSDQDEIEEELIPLETKAIDSTPGEIEEELTPTETNAAESILDEIEEELIPTAAKAAESAPDEIEEKLIPTETKAIDSTLDEIEEELTPTETNAAESILDEIEEELTPTAAKAAESAPDEIEETLTPTEAEAIDSTLDEIEKELTPVETKAAESILDEIEEELIPFEAKATESAPDEIEEELTPAEAKTTDSADEKPTHSPNFKAVEPDDPAPSTSNQEVDSSLLAKISDNDFDITAQPESYFSSSVDDHKNETTEIDLAADIEDEETTRRHTIVPTTEQLSSAGESKKSPTDDAEKLVDSVDAIDDFATQRQAPEETLNDEFALISNEFEDRYFKRPLRPLPSIPRAKNAPFQQKLLSGLKRFTSQTTETPTPKRPLTKDNPVGDRQERTLPQKTEKSEIAGFTNLTQKISEIGKNDENKIAPDQQETPNQDDLQNSSAEAKPEGALRNKTEIPNASTFEDTKLGSKADDKSQQENDAAQHTLNTEKTDTIHTEIEKPEIVGFTDLTQKISEIGKNSANKIASDQQETSNQDDLQNSSAEAKPEETLRNKTEIPNTSTFENTMLSWKADNKSEHANDSADPILTPEETKAFYTKTKTQKTSKIAGLTQKISEIGKNDENKIASDQPETSEQPLTPEMTLRNKTEIPNASSLDDTIRLLEADDKPETESNSAEPAQLTKKTDIRDTETEEHATSGLADLSQTISETGKKNENKTVSDQQETSNQDDLQDSSSDARPKVTPRNKTEVPKTSSLEETIQSLEAYDKSEIENDSAEPIIALEETNVFSTEVATTEKNEHAAASELQPVKSDSVTKNDSNQDKRKPEKTIKVEPDITTITPKQPEPEGKAQAEALSPEQKLQKFVQLGAASYSKRDYEEAIIFFKKALQIDRSVHDIYAMLGNAYFRNNMLQDALNAYTILHEKDNDNEMALENIGLICWQLGEKERAIENWQALLEKNPERTDLVARINVAQKSLNRGKTPVKPVDAPKNKSIAPSDTDSSQLQPDQMAILQRGVELYKQHDHEAAIALFQKAVDMVQNKTEAYRFLGNTYFRNKMYDEAAKIFERLKLIDHNDARTLENLGFVRMKQGNFKAAITEWRTVLEFEPHRKDLQNNIRKFENMT